MKILIISAVPMRNDTNMGKTLIKLFGAFKPEELSCLYLGKGIPNSAMCSSYFHFGEEELLKGLLLFKDAGEVVEPKISDVDLLKSSHRSYLIRRHKDNIILRYVRESLWSTFAFKRHALECWLTKQQFDLVFYVLQDTNASIGVLNWILSRYDKSSVLYVTDDYANDFRAGGRVRRAYFSKRKIFLGRVAPRIVKVIGVSDMATKWFVDMLEPAGGGATFLTPAGNECLLMPLHEQAEEGIVKIRYFGNLGLGRWQALHELGKSVESLNLNGRKAILEVYSNIDDDEVVKALEIDGACTYKGWVYGEEYLTLLQDADVVVHVESFDEDMLRRTRLSISTKIADYLGAGKCILALGSLSLASILHIKNVAYVVDSYSKLHDALLDLAGNAELRRALQIRARELAMLRHNPHSIPNDFKSTMEEFIQS